MYATPTTSVTQPETTMKNPSKKRDEVEACLASSRARTTIDCSKQITAKKM